MASTEARSAATHGAGETVAVDGRVARSARTRRAIVDAMRALHHEGDLRPTAPRVAERAGVSVRTVWQHFEDLEALLVEAGRRDLEIAQTFVEPIPPSLPAEERVRRVVEQRSRMFEAMAPPWRAALLHAPFSAQIRRNRDELMGLARLQLEEVFAAELDAAAEGRVALLDALHTATSWPAWETLRTDVGIDVPRAKQAITLLLSKLCAIA